MESESKNKRGMFDQGSDVFSDIGVLTDEFVKRVLQTMNETVRDPRQREYIQQMIQYISFPAFDEQGKKIGEVRMSFDKELCQAFGQTEKISRQS